MKQSDKLKKIRNLNEFFIQKLKPKKPVILSIRNLKNLNGSYHYNKLRHLIVLNKNDNLITMYDSLTHEWGHLLQTNKREYYDDILDHSDNWGLKFAKVYRTYLEWANL